MPTPKVLIVIGTRPEAIKMAPVIKALENPMHVEVCVTAQHRDMLDQVLATFDIHPVYDLNIMQPGQDLFDVTGKVLAHIKSVLIEASPAIVLVHGDTTTAFITSLAAFYLNIPVAHVEAGLRTHDVRAPFPEEFNRQAVARIARLHFAPTPVARDNLLAEHISPDHIVITGNTVIDALLYTLEQHANYQFPKTLTESLPFLEQKKPPKIILVTGHRRENFGEKFRQICEALKEVAQQFPEVQIIYPVHLNPNIRVPVNAQLSNISNIHLIEPLDYIPFIKLMEQSYLILTDSGGIQEEAPSLGKPVLVMRDVTEREEAIHAGTVKLVGTDKTTIVATTAELLQNTSHYNMMAMAHNPYGDGNASHRIYQALADFFGEEKTHD
jgi:UDP-N-acetylglucosamine 2-epimerase (non-hydrolysing)